MNAPEILLLPDTQALPDARQLAIRRVGVKGLRYPLSIRSPDGGTQPVLATLDMYVALPADVKGTHMSRFVEAIEAIDAPLDFDGFRALFGAMLARLGARRGHLEMRFVYFIRKAAPVSNVESLLDYEARWCVSSEGEGPTLASVGLTAPVTSLCPCSKRISDYGAHNQRSHVTIDVDLGDGTIALEELARVAEDEASCEVFGLLKRPDEKWVTERAYDNPKFVEDLVRDLAIRLGSDPRVRRFRVSSENFESIHNHSAYAEVDGHGAARP